MDIKIIESISSSKHKEDEQILNLFKLINPDSDDLVSLVRNLRKFNQALSSLKDITNFLNEDNLYILQNLNYRDNVRINLLLVNIYIKIISNQSLYSTYLADYTEEKLHLILQIFDECITLITKLPGFILDPEIFKLKEKTLSLIKCIYFNWKGKITNLAITQKLEEYIDTLPEQFYSETYNKMNDEKDSYDILNSTNIEKIKNFEDNFSQINNYFEQYESFKKFAEYNSRTVNCTGVGNDNEDKAAENLGVNSEKIDFLKDYGILLLKFCKYHYYIFLNQENKEEQNNIISDDTNGKTRVVFLLDKIKQYKDDLDEMKSEENLNDLQKAKGSKNIAELLDHKSFVSIFQSKEYDELIKKELKNYIDITKEYNTDDKIKDTLEQMTYFLDSIEKESCIPLYLNNFGKITFSDNFTPSFMFNVSAGKTNELYLETKVNETMLIYIEFTLENNSKDINLEINKYELFSDEFKNIFKEEKIENNFKLFLLCNGCSLYQIIFDNYYSWFTSKDISYKITLLKLEDKPTKELEIQENNEEEKKEEKKEEEIKEKEKEKEEEKEEEIKNEIKEEIKNEIKEEPKEEIKEEKTEEIKEKIIKKDIKEEPKIEEKIFTCDINGQNLTFNTDEICQKIKSCIDNKNENIINIPVIIYLNTLRIVSFKNKECEYKLFKEEEEDEELVTKALFDYKIKHHISKVLKLKQSDLKNKKIIISIFSQNRDLAVLYEDVSEKIKEENNTPEDINYLKKIGFIPKEDIEGYKVEFKLYDLCDQSLLYHLFINSYEGKGTKKNSLFILFDNGVVNASLFDQNAIVNKVKGKGKKNIKLNNLDIKDEKGFFDLLKKLADKYKDIEIALSCINYKKEEGKNLEELIEKIKKYGDEINSNVVIYDESQIAFNVFNYMNLFYEN